MDKYNRAILAIVISVLAVSLLYVIWVIYDIAIGSYESNFPFVIFLPVMAAIFIPLIAEAKKRQEEMQKEEIFKENSEINLEV